MALSPSDNDRYRLLQTAFDTIEEGIVVLDREFKVILANKWMEMRYSSKRPLVGKQCYEAFHSRQAPCPDCQYLRSLETGTPQLQVMKDASDCQLPGWYEVSAYALRDSHGDTIGAIEHIKDVTERKRAEDLLRDEISRRRILVEQSGDGIVVLDESGKVFEANQEFCRMVGYSMEELHRLHVWDWSTQWDEKDLLRRLEAVDTSGSHFETRHRRKRLYEAKQGGRDCCVGPVAQLHRR